MDGPVYTRAPMIQIRVDLYSDTKTRPTPEMRRAIAIADVGDEQDLEDPSVNRLQDMVAELLGKEAALFLPSGTMCNQISFALHCQAGDEIIADRTAHPYTAEAGGPAAIARALVRPLHGERGIFTGDQVRAAIRMDVVRTPTSRVVSVENTTNFGGGACWPMERIHEVTEVAREHGLATHLDGARLMNAVVATGVSAREHAMPFDTAWIDLSKGLGAPIGAVLAASSDLIGEAWRWKQRLGGAMRQAGIVAAAGIYALERHVDRLADDHVNARLLAEGLAELPGIVLDPANVETNIVVFNIEGLTAPEFADRMLTGFGIRFTTLGPHTLRAVTHLDVAKDGIEEALAAAVAVLGE